MIFMASAMMLPASHLQVFTFSHQRAQLCLPKVAMGHPEKTYRKRFGPIVYLVGWWATPT